MKKTLSLDRFVRLPLLFLASSFLFFCTSVFADKSPQAAMAWADLYSADTSASIDFYQQLLGWQAKPVTSDGTNYHLFWYQGKPVAGMLARPSSREGSVDGLWIGSFSTPSKDIPLRIKAFEAAAAKLLLAPHDFAIYGTRAVLADAGGAVFALLDCTEGNTSPLVGSPWVWSQLFAQHPQRSSELYAQSFGYHVISGPELKGQRTYLLQAQGENLAGVVQLPKNLPQRDMWVNFIAVDNLQETLDKAAILGAKLIYHSEGVRPLAIISDPSGAVLGLAERLVIPGQQEVSNASL